MSRIGFVLTGVAAALAARIPAQFIVNEDPHLKPVPFTQVEIKDRFWAPRREINRKVSLRHSLDMLEKSGCVKNFELAAKGAKEGYQGFVFADSDLYKVVESVSYSLATDPDPVLTARVDRLITILASAQQDDGYLNSYYQVKEPGRRFTNLRDNHELYCAGHLFEAAVAHFQATKKRTLLQVATKYADLLAATFGPGTAQRQGYCGHPEIELALVKLWGVTGKQAYFDLAKFFIESRGTKFFATEHKTPLEQYDGTYWQDDMPIRDHQSIKGHAVRAAYLMSGCVDVAGVTHDRELLAMVDRVWRNTTMRNMYVTGGIGSSGSNEGFTHDYDLPNASAYQETCASVAMAMWNHRLALLYGDAKYADVMETALYNGVLAGVSFDGNRYFYVNPLQSSGSHHRSEWFACACCPPNVTRTLASLGTYAYATDSSALYVNLYVQGAMWAKVGGVEAKFDVETDYPWDGKVKLTYRGKAGRFSLHLRVPAWCAKMTTSVKSDVPGSSPSAERGYTRILRAWVPGDVVEVDLDMTPRRVVAHPKVRANLGLSAFARGPLVYCFEGADIAVNLGQVWIPADGQVKVVEDSGLPGGGRALEVSGFAAPTNWQQGLYQTYQPTSETNLRAIPYYAWDNRKPGAMRVWLPLSPPIPSLAGFERAAVVSLSNVSGYARPTAIRDGIEPKASGEHPGDLCHWWPRKGTKDDWVRYEWDKDRVFNSARVYWFDDTGSGECRLPKSWRITYFDGKDWLPVQLSGSSATYPIQLNSWCEVEFRSVTGRQLRLEFEMQDGWSVGIHEWQVFGPGMEKDR